MLPKFPQFKPLELSDREEIEKITSKYDAYSDFDFASMWSWDIKGNIRISEINGNIVAILADHFSADPFYSFFGENLTNETVKQIFAFSEITATPLPALRSVPEVSLRSIDFKKFLIEIDLNNCDYIYRTRDLADYEGSKFSHKRKFYQRFLRNNPRSRIELLNISDPRVQRIITDFSTQWADNKSDENSELNLDKEHEAIQRFLNAGFTHAICVALFVEEKMVGYQLCTPSTKKYAICHFGKTDIAYQGAFEYMMCENAKILRTSGIEFLNTEEDLGLPKLRYTKNSYNPVTFLRKYMIREL